MTLSRLTNTKSYIKQFTGTPSDIRGHDCRGPLTRAVGRGAAAAARPGIQQQSSPNRIGHRACHTDDVGQAFERHLQRIPLEAGEFASASVRSLSGKEDEKKTFKAFRYAYRFHRTAA